jgi:hypothetical protein
MARSCIKCGAFNRDTARFCTVCGAALPAGARPMPQPKPASQPPPMPAQLPSPGTSAPPAMFPQSVSTSAWLVASNGQRYPLSATSTIGRVPGCSIILPDSSVSSQHATLTQVGGRWQLTDNGSSNGTFVNGQRVGSSPCQLKNGDQLTLGTVTLRFETSSGTTLIQPSQLPGVQSPASVISQPSGGWFAPKVRGEVLMQPSEHQDQPPTDWTRVMVGLSVALAFLGALLTFFITLLAASIILICVGGAVLIPLLFFLFAPVQMLFSAIMGALKDDKPVTIVNFQIQDEFSGSPVDVTFIRKRGTRSGLAQSDVVEVWGRQHGGAAITATKIRVVERQHTPISAYIPIRRPWPWWIGIMTLAIAVAAVLYGYAAMGGHF